MLSKVCLQVTEETLLGVPQNRTIHRAEIPTALQNEARPESVRLLCKNNRDHIPRLSDPGDSQSCGGSTYYYQIPLRTYIYGLRFVSPDFLSLDLFNGKSDMRQQ
jgi:hypothetical protein